MKKIVIIDGKSVFYRGYHAMGRLALSDGTPTGGVYGFAVIAMELVKRIKPDKVVVAWDKAKTSVSKRVALYPEYKAGRVKPGEDFFRQIPLLKELIAGLSWDFLECDDYEADDIIGTLAKQGALEGWESFIVSSDKDMLQIVGERIKMLRLLKGFSELEEVDVREFEEKYGIAQRQFLDLKALAGDTSDNIPGVPGVGEKTAIKILQNVENIEELYEALEEDEVLVETEGDLLGKRTEAAGESVEALAGARERKNAILKVLSKKMQEKILAGKEMAFLSKKLAKIMFDAPVDVKKVKDFEWKKEEVARILKKLEFLSLIKKFGLETEAKVGGDGDDGVMMEKYAFGDINEMEICWDVKAEMHADEQFAERILRGGKYYDLLQARFLLGVPLKSGISDYASGDIKRQEFLKQQKMFLEKREVLKVYEGFDLPLISILYKMEKKGMRINVEKFKELKGEITGEVAKLEEEIWEVAEGEFNVNSPVQLAEVLFGRLGLSTKGITKTKRGYSTGAKELAKLTGKHEVIEKIKRYREKKKLLSTYVEPMLKLVDERGRIHTTFTQNVTSTGRLSSLDPNLQNIPVRTEEGKKIREGFEVAKGKMLVSADYAQFELRLAAALAGDEKLIQDFNAGIDIHTKTAADVFGVSMEQVSKEQRRAAKVINFGVLYGMSAKGLADATGMKFFEADNFIKDYFVVRNRIAEYLKETLEFAREHGYVQTFFGRRRLVPDVMAANFLVRAAAERAAMNMPIQGTEADLMKKAMIAVDGALPVGAELVCQVHDSLIVECDEGLVGEVEEILLREMEGVGNGLPVRLAVDVSHGRNWGEI